MTAHSPADLSPEHERYAGALAIERTHGETAIIYFVKRINALALAGDVAGIQRWREIAERLDRLTTPAMLS